MSSAFRITQHTVSTTMLNGLQQSLDRLQNLQQQMSSGKSINKASDNPVGTVAAMQYRSESARTSQYSRNAQDGLGILGLTDTTLTSSLDQIQRVRELVLQGINASSDPAAHEAQAAEIDGIRGSLIGVANTTYLNRPIFAGNANVTAAYDSTGNYLGDNGAVTRTVAPSTDVPVNLTGPQVFGTGSNNLFNIMSQISTDLRAGNTAGLGNDLQALDNARENIQTQLSDVGARYNRVDALRQQANDHVTTITNSLSEVEDIDLPKTIVSLQLQQVAYQAALGATAKVVTPSLIDFLR